MTIHPTLDDYKYFASQVSNLKEGGFADYYWQGVLHGDDGKDYFLIFSLAHMGNGSDLIKLEISTESLWLFTTPSSSIIQQGEKPEISIGGFKPVGSLKVRQSESSVTAYCDEFETILTPPTFVFRYKGSDVSLDINVKSMGVPFWYSKRNENGARITPSTVCWGHELFGEGEGSITIGNTKIHVKGPCVNEHVIVDPINWLEYGWHNWAWFVFDEMYGLVQETQHAQSFQVGGIFLRDTQEYLEVRKLNIENTKWAFSQVLQQNFPVASKIRAYTDEGILLIVGEAVRSQPWGRVNKYSLNTKMCATEMEMVWHGSFSYNDGRKIKLNNGKGVNEVIGSFSSIGSNP